MGMTLHLCFLYKRSDYVSYVAMGPYAGGQAVCDICVKLLDYADFPCFQEYVRVPFADFNALKLPPGTEHEADFALLADIFPTVSSVSLSSYRILKLTLSK